VAVGIIDEGRGVASGGDEFPEQAVVGSARVVLKDRVAELRVGDFGEVMLGVEIEVGNLAERVFDFVKVIAGIVDELGEK
jgi:hypothetical protein